MEYCQKVPYDNRADQKDQPPGNGSGDTGDENPADQAAAPAGIKAVQIPADEPAEIVVF